MIYENLSHWYFRLSKINYISIPLQKIDHFTGKMCCRSVSELVQGSSQEENWKNDKKGTWQCKMFYLEINEGHLSSYRNCADARVLQDN